MTLYIKNMVSLRCKMKVEDELRKLGIEFSVVDLGMVKLSHLITIEQHDLLQIALQSSGLELVDDRKTIISEKIKKQIIHMIHFTDYSTKVNFSEYLSNNLHYDYVYLSNVFTEANGTTIENYMITQKIEWVKELLSYDELNVTEISYALHYSSVAHLSNQFKRVTGQTPSSFKKINMFKKRLCLEDL